MYKFKNILSAESYKKGILISTIFSFISKVLVFVNGLIIAFYFGSTTTVDFYFYMVSFISLVTTVISSLNQTVLIPEAMTLRTRVGNNSSVHFLNYFLLIYFTVGFLAVIITYSNPVYFIKLFSNFGIKTIIENYNQIRLMLPLLLLMVISSILVDICTSYRYFTFPMIINVVNSTFSTIFILLLHNSLSIKSAALGLLLGYFCNNIFLLIFLFKKLGWSFEFKSVHITSKVKFDSIYIFIGSLISTSFLYIPVFLFSGFDAGTITSYNYGNSLSMLPNQLITIQFSSVAAIKLNELFAKKKSDEFAKTFIKSTNILVFFMTIIAGIYFLLSNEIITLAMKRGRFDDNAVATTAYFLKYLGFLLPLLAISTMLSRIFVAAKKIKESFYFQIISNIIYSVFLFFCVKIFGITGYVFGVLIVYLFNISLMIILFKNHFIFIDFLNILSHYIKTNLLNIFIVMALFTLIHNCKIYNNFVTISIVSSIYLILIIILNNLFKINSDFTESLKSVSFKFFKYLNK
jgi:putative peptidoglycan lipid II flippase